MTITAGDYANLRARYQRSSFYLSILKPLNLWVANVNMAGAARGRYDITFDGGNGLDFTAIEADQTVWVGSGIGLKDYGVLRIRSISSPDNGLTGTLSVAWHGYVISDDAFLTFVHDYPFTAKYPWLGQDDILGTTEVFYKDVFDTYNQETEADKIKPVVDVDWSSRAGFIENGELVFWLDASPSYAMSVGATIVSYALAVYPTTGVTATINALSGAGYIIVTDTTQDYYWAKVTVTDDQGNSRSAYYCLFAYDEQSGNMPIVDFQVDQHGDDWEGGDVTARVSLNKQLTDIFIGDRQAIDMIETATAILWRENVAHDTFINQRRIPKVRADDHLFVAPAISATVVSSGGACNIDTTFESGVRIANGIVGTGAIIGLHVQVNAEAAIAVNGSVTNGVVTATHSFAALAGACTSGTLKWLYSGTIIAQQTIYSGLIINASTIYPSDFLTFPTNLLVGYIFDDSVDQELDNDTGKHSYNLASVVSLMKNNYMFSIPIDAKQSPTEWYHFHANMTTATAAMFVIDFHSNLLNVASVVGIDKDTVLRAYGEFEGANLYQMIDGITNHTGIRAHWKADRNGKVHMVYDVQLLVAAERSTLDIFADYDLEDMLGEMSIKERSEPNVALVYGSGLYWAGSFDADGNVGNDQVEAYCCLAPWYLPNHKGGQGTASFERQTVLSQANLNELTGRVYGRSNAPYERFTWGTRGLFFREFLRLEYEEFWTVSIQTVDNIKSLVFNTQKIMLRNVECQIDVFNGVMTTNTSWEPEVESQDAVTAICPEIDISIDGIPPEDWEEPPGLLPGTIITSS
jgi:hypothetical protein